MHSTIYLLRHGIAEDPRPELDDEERHLTPAGKRKMARAAQGLKRLGVKPDLVLSSPLHRAMETATIAARALMPNRPVQVYTPLAPGHSPEQVVRGLKEFATARRIFLVGHEPSMSELFSYLLTGSSGLVSVAFKKGAMAAIHVAGVPPRNGGTLGWFMTSKQQRAAARRPAS